MSSLVVGGGYRRDKLIKFDICVLVVVVVGFVPIVEELGETGFLEGLGKHFLMGLEVMEEDSLFCRKSHLGDIVLVFSDCHAIGEDAFTPLWCAMEF